MSNKGEIESEINALKIKYKSEIESLERVEPIFGTLKKLRSLIREKGIQGYKGLLIDFLDFDPKFSSCIDLAAKSKLFSIIVEDLDAAKQILSLN
jgi:chromosome segregation ATPase